MKKVLNIIGIIIISFGLWILLLKLNSSGVGKFVPFGNDGAIINTSTGTVYIAKEKNYDELVWEKMISFPKKNK